MAGLFSGGHDNSGFLQALSSGFTSLGQAASALTGGGGGNSNTKTGGTTDKAAPTAGAAGSRPTPTSMTPSFLAEAAVPNFVAPPQSNVGGKSLLGQ